MDSTLSYIQQTNSSNALINEAKTEKFQAKDLQLQERQEWQEPFNLMGSDFLLSGVKGLGGKVVKRLGTVVGSDTLQNIGEGIKTGNIKDVKTLTKSLTETAKNKLGELNNTADEAESLMKKPIETAKNAFNSLKNAGDEALSNKTLFQRVFGIGNKVNAEAVLGRTASGDLLSNEEQLKRIRGELAKSKLGRKQLRKTQKAQAKADSDVAEGASGAETQPLPEKQGDDVKEVSADVFQQINPFTDEPIIRKQEETKEPEQQEVLDDEGKPIQDEEEKLRIKMETETDPRFIKQAQEAIKAEKLGTPDRALESQAPYLKETKIGDVTIPSINERTLESLKSKPPDVSIAQPKAFDPKERGGVKVLPTEEKEPVIDIKNPFLEPVEEKQLPDELRFGAETAKAEITTQSQTFPNPLFDPTEAPETSTGAPSFARVPPQQIKTDTPQTLSQDAETSDTIEEQNIKASSGSKISGDDSDVAEGGAVEEGAELGAADLIDPLVGVGLLLLPSLIGGNDEDEKSTIPQENPSSQFGDN